MGEEKDKKKKLFEIAYKQKLYLSNKSKETLKNFREHLRGFVTFQVKKEHRFLA